MLLNPRARFGLAREVQSEAGSTLGAVFTFLSSLYFRGKLAYARRFGDPPGRLLGAYVITPGRGLRHEGDRVTAADLRALAEVEVAANNADYAAPLARDAAALAELAPPPCEFVLLGSIATTKYTEPLLEALGERLLFPSEFVGRGDMSRGGLLLRCARAGSELDYRSLASSPRRGARARRIAELELPPAKK